MVVGLGGRGVVVGAGAEKGGRGLVPVRAWWGHRGGKGGRKIWNRGQCRVVAPDGASAGWSAFLGQWLVRTVCGSIGGRRFW